MEVLARVWPGAAGCVADQRMAALDKTAADAIKAVTAAI